MDIKQARFNPQQYDKNPPWGIFDGEKYYTITRYQRSYVWGVDQAQGVIDDIEFIRNENIDVSWPSILVEQNLSQRDTQEINYLVGDGQQRLTTVFLAYAAIYNSWLCIKDFEAGSDAELYFSQNSLLGSSSQDSKAVLGRVWKDDDVLQAYPRLVSRDKKVNDLLQSIITLPALGEETLSLATLRDPKSEEREKLMSGDTTLNNIYCVFFHFFDYFSSRTSQQLVEDFAILSKRIVVPVSIYQPNEFMLRAFSNMNSRGIALSESDLIKSLIYEKAKRLDPLGETADKFADDWNSKLEGQEWADDPKRVTKLLTNQNMNNLEKFLSQYLHYRLYWDESSLANKTNSHWLRNAWDKLLLSHGSTYRDFSELLSDFWRKVDLYKSWNFTESYPADNPKWLFLYTKRSLVGVVNADSVLFAVTDRVEKAEQAELLWLLMKYFFYMTVEKADVVRLPYSQILVNQQSPVRNKSFTAVEVEKYLGATEATWRSKDDFKKVIKLNRYKKRVNANLSAAFVFITNLDKKERNLNGSLFDPSSIKSFKSLEHILPTKPEGFDGLSLEKQLEHNDYVNSIGNLTVLSFTENTRISNKDPLKKLEEYKKIDYSPWGPKFSDSLVRLMSKTDKWGYDEIEERSEQLAEMFASYLSFSGERPARSTAANAIKSKAFLLVCGDDILIESKKTDPFAAVNELFTGFLKEKLQVPVYMTRFRAHVNHKVYFTDKPTILIVDSPKKHFTEVAKNLYFRQTQVGHWEQTRDELIAILGDEIELTVPVDNEQPSSLF